MWIKSTKFDGNRRSHFWDNEKLNFFLCELPLILRVARKRKKPARDICKGTIDIEFEWNCSFGLGAMLGDGPKIRNYFYSFRDYSGKNR